METFDKTTTEDEKNRALDLIDKMKNAGFKGNYIIGGNFDGITYDVVWEKSEIVKYGIGFFWHGGDDHVKSRVRYKDIYRDDFNFDLGTATNDELIELLEDYNLDDYIIAWTGLFGKKKARWIMGDKINKYKNDRKYDIYKF